MTESEQAAGPDGPVVHNRRLLAIQWILSARLHTAGEPVLEVTVYNNQAIAVFRTFTSRGGYYSVTPIMISARA